MSNTTWIAILSFALVLILLEGSYRFASEQHKKISALTARIRKLQAESQARTLLRFNKAGAPLPGSRNIAGANKTGPNALAVQFEKPVSDNTHVAAMSGTPHVKKFDLDHTGKAANIVLGGPLGNDMGLKFEE